MLQVKWLKTFTDLYADEDMLYFNEDSGKVVFSCNEMGIVNIDINNIKQYQFEGIITFCHLKSW